MSHPLFGFPEPRVRPSTIARMRSGPLGPFVDEFATRLQDLGYQAWTAHYRVRAVAALSEYMQRGGIGISDLRMQTLSNFLQRRRSRGQARGGERLTLHMLYDLLCDKGIVARVSHSLHPSPIERALDPFIRHLIEERALAPKTALHHKWAVKAFLGYRFAEGPIRFDRLRPKDVARFVVHRMNNLSIPRMRGLMVGLRSFFRYLLMRGLIKTDLAGCTPKVPGWNRQTLPKGVPPSSVRQLLRSCDRRDAAGLRDYAIILLLAQLGLRAGEIVAMQLEDLDWDGGALVVRGKDLRHTRLPLPEKAARAIAAYLQRGRPRVASRHVFLRTIAPMRPLSGAYVISSLVHRAFVRAGLNPPRKGAHQLRHTIACQMLRRGASLREIGELLRQRRLETTAIYAKVDLVQLRTVAMRWPMVS